MSVEQPQPWNAQAPGQTDPWAAGPGAPAGYTGGAALQGQPPSGPPGTVRSTGVCILLTIVTFGLYTWFWYFRVHEEMKRHTGQGIGGVVALLLAVFFWMAAPFLLSSEVGRLYERRGKSRPVSALTGLWFFPGVFLLVGPIIWFVLTNRALNAYWRSFGAR